MQRIKKTMTELPVEACDNIGSSVHNRILKMEEKNQRITYRVASLLRYSLTFYLLENHFQVLLLMFSC